MCWAPRIAQLRIMGMGHCSICSAISVGAAIASAGSVLASSMIQCTCSARTGKSGGAVSGECR